MTHILIEIDGKQITVSSDPRSDDIWIQLCVCKGSLGISLTPKQAAELNCAITAAIRARR